MILYSQTELAKSDFVQNTVLTLVGNNKDLVLISQLTYIMWLKSTVLIVMSGFQTKVLARCFVAGTICCLAIIMQSDEQVGVLSASSVEQRKTFLVHSPLLLRCLSYCPMSPTLRFLLQAHCNGSSYFSESYWYGVLVMLITQYKYLLYLV